jgi:hypothetical protein
MQKEVGTERGPGGQRGGGGRRVVVVDTREMQVWVSICTLRGNGRGGGGAKEAYSGSREEFCAKFGNEGRWGGVWFVGGWGRWGLVGLIGYIHAHTHTHARTRARIHTRIRWLVEVVDV